MKTETRDARKQARLPETEMYRALVARDTSYDGAFYAAIRTTGIFCRPGCGAKKPKRENVEFFADTGAALRAGYRACLRCKPLEPAGRPPAWIERLLARVEKQPLDRVSAEDLREDGIDPARASRWFKAHYGLTFQAWQRGRRLSLALAKIRGGGSVTRAAHESGFESESGFRDAFARLFGAPPSRAAAAGADVLRVRWISTPLGPVLAAATSEGVCLLEFVDRRAIERQIKTLRRHFDAPIVPGTNAHLDRLAREFAQYFAGDSIELGVPIVAPGTPFQERVWSELAKIPPGETRSYAAIARAIGRPTAVRAVARANGDNRIALLIPCHRVVGSDGAPTGYAGGIWRKEWLLEHEHQHAHRAPRPSRTRVG